MKYLNDNQLILGDASKERFLNPQSVPALNALGVTMAGTTDVVDEYLCSRRAPHHHRLLVSIEGHATVRSQNAQFSISPEQIILLPAGQNFVYQSDEPWKFIWFMFDQNLASNLMPSSLSVESFEFSEESFHICVLLLLCDDPLTRESLGKRLSKLIERALIAFVDSQSGSNKLHRLFSNVEQQLHLVWSVNDLAKLMHCSKASLHRHCMGQYNCSPMHKVTELRMTRACDLLTQTDWSIKQISQQVGFKDPLNFSHRFKQWHNLSPKNYREHK